MQVKQRVTANQLHNSQIIDNFTYFTFQSAHVCTIPLMPFSTGYLIMHTLKTSDVILTHYNTTMLLHHSININSICQKITNIKLIQS